MGPLRQALRDGTTQAHGRLDGLWPVERLIEPAIYGAFLSAMASALVPIEGALRDAGVVGLLPDWPARERGAAVMADLAGLGRAWMPVQAEAGATDMRSGPLDAPRMLGLVYVLEGSRLGSELLRRTVSESPHALVRDNLRYLSHGRGGALWRGFAERLDGMAPGPDDLASAIDGARAGFAAYERASRIELARPALAA